MSQRSWWAWRRSKHLVRVMTGDDGLFAIETEDGEQLYAEDNSSLETEQEQ